MQPIKQATKSKRAFLLSPQLLFCNSNSVLSLSQSSPLLYPLFNGKNNSKLPILYHYCYYSTLSAIPIQEINFPYKNFVQSVKEWFKTHNTPNHAFLDRVFEILSNQDEVDDLALSQLGVHLTESLVLDVLKYGNKRNDVYSCIKFFDWAGRQPGFQHTRATFYAIFKILSRAKRMPIILAFLDDFMKHRFINRNFGYTGYGFYATLVLGYSVAGKPQVALHMFGRMRFQGLDLDAFAYHVLLNSLVEERCFDAVDSIAKQISIRGFGCHMTHCIVVKSFCKQRMLDEAEAYLRRVILQGENGNGTALRVLVDAFCQKGQFEKVGQLVEEFRELGVVSMEPAYAVWLQNLVRSGKLDEALELLHHKKSSEIYVPEVSQYNVFLCRLLKENRLTEAFNLLMEMMEGGISPDKVTINAALCLFCKAGMVDVALDLYNCKSELGLSPSTMACNYLINSLCVEGSIDEAYYVLKNSSEQGYFPGKKVFSVLTDALCREGKLEMMNELALVALEHKFMPSDSTYEKFILALCRARRVEDAYGELNQMIRVATKATYSILIYGFCRINKGDIAARLLIEMQDKGHMATRLLFRAVIQSLFQMENPETQFSILLNKQLSLHEPNSQIYNFFIDGAGHAKKPDIAREVFEMMQRNGIRPTLSSDILMLQSYLKSKRISDALRFFESLRQRRKIGRKLYNTIIVGLCKVDRVDFALSFFWEMQNNGMVPSVECYEVLIMELCSNKDYDRAIQLVKDFESTGRRITSFIGNIFLLHSLKSKELYDAWVRAGKQNETSSNLSILGQIIGAFSSRLRFDQQIVNWDEVIEQCFPLDLYTYNMLLRALSKSNIEDALELFDRLCQKGYEPNNWTYDILVHGRTTEARRLVDEIFRKRGYRPSQLIVPKTPM